MFIRKDDLKPFDHKVYLASSTMHGEELKYMTEVYSTNWMSTIGENINEVERIAAEKAGIKYAVALCNCISDLHLCCKFAGGIRDVEADIFERGCCLPSDSKMTPQEQDKIIEVIKRCFE